MEAEERPKAFEELGRQIQIYMKVIEAYKTKVTWHCQQVVQEGDQGGGSRDFTSASHVRMSSTTTWMSWR